MIAGAGKDRVADLARCLATNGIRVVVMDRDEDSVLRIAREAPGRIEPLQFDELRPDHCALLRRIWAEEPLILLINLQILRHASYPAMAMRSVIELTKALQPALRAGRGQSIYMFPDLGDDTMTRSLHGAYRKLACALQAELADHGVAVNGVMLPPGGFEAIDPERLAESLSLLMHPRATRFGGTVLPLLPRCD